MTFVKGNTPKNKGIKRPGIGGRPKGITAWNKGIKRWWKSPTEFKKGHINWNKGIKLPLEMRIKMSERMKGVSSGEKSNFWKGGITPKYIQERNKLKTSIEYRLWRESVFARDNWTCQKCDKRGSQKIHPHHIKNWIDNLEIRTSIENGITLCEKCHMLFHKEYGRKNNNKEQIIKFLNKCL